MNSEDQALIEKYGITVETMTIFHFAGYRYERLSDAVNYAKTRPRTALRPKIEHEN